MAGHAQTLAQRAHLIEQDLSRLAEGSSSAQLIDRLQEYRVACEQVILADFEYALNKDIETQLWAAHLKINGIYRKELRSLKRNARGHVVENRKLIKHYLQFIKTSQRFYRQHILNLDTLSDGIPELRKLAQKWGDDAAKSPSRKSIPAKLKSRVLLTCHQTLIQLGDLSRYRETELVEKNRNWGPAKGYYDLAADIYPDSGVSHNQLAVISREDGDHFRSVYHLYRSLAAKQPHPQAKGNLELEFKKIIAAWSKGELINNHKSPEGNSAGRALVAWFIRLHSKCYKGEEFPQFDELESEVLSHLAIELKERPLDSILQKIILINMAAEYKATVQMSIASDTRPLVRAYFYYLRLNVKTFFTLLQILQSELERLSEGYDVTKNGDRAPQLSDKITVVARRVLPGLRLYSTWFFRYWHVLNAHVADTLTTVEVQELWKAYAATLTLLASSFPADQLPKDQYMLEEDTETIGFQPLVSKETRKLWYIDERTMKQKWTDLERNHPNIEMLMRVRDLLIDGLQLTQDEKAPLDLAGLRFIYREAGLPSELLASPNNAADASPALPAETMELPLFPQETPVADDQKSQSVAAPPSESASTTIAKDSAMNRMVDDLVGPDDGLDPLLEEDENIPPTPPAQTFEDTALVNESTYGLNSITISDLVNTVQNYNKPIGSPSPVTPHFATPMNRVGSSSSVRQVANLPSVPDGQSNGNSIWNLNPGASGPSSPMMTDGNDFRGSPLNGYRSSGLSGHARGDSSNSLRSNEWGAPMATPVHRAVSGGLGSGAAWGNPAASVYSSVYGNGNNYPYNQSLDTTDINLASPLLFGKGSSWNPDLQRNHSSYGRTPPNGQGG